MKPMLTKQKLKKPLLGKEKPTNMKDEGWEGGRTRNKSI